MHRKLRVVTVVFDELGARDTHLASQTQQSLSLRSEVTEKPGARFLARKERSISTEPLTKSVHEERLHEQEYLDGRVPVCSKSCVLP